MRELNIAELIDANEAQKFLCIGDLILVKEPLFKNFVELINAAGGAFIFTCNQRYSRHFFTDNLF